MTWDTLGLLVGFLALAAFMASVGVALGVFAAAFSQKDRRDRHIKHTDLAQGHRCPCHSCVAFRREMGWPP